MNTALEIRLTTKNNDETNLVDYDITVEGTNSYITRYISTSCEKILMQYKMFLNWCQ